MVLKTTIFSCLSFIALAAAAPRPRNILDKRSTPLKVTLKSGTGNGVVMAQITNTGSEDLSLLKHGSLLSDQPIQKLNVYNGGVFPKITGFLFYILGADCISR